MRPFEMEEIASLADLPSPTAISIAIKNALEATNDQGMKAKDREDLWRDYFCMQQQLKPVITYLSEITKA